MLQFASFVFKTQLKDFTTFFLGWVIITSKQEATKKSDKNKQPV